MNDYRQFWNTLFYGTSDGFAGTYDITEYWLRLIVVVAVGLLLGIASVRQPRIPHIATALCIVVWAAAVGPFLLWAARCGGCGSASSYDSARSYEAMIINQAWGGLLAIAIASVWTGHWLTRQLR